MRPCSLHPVGVLDQDVSVLLTFNRIGGGTLMGVSAGVAFAQGPVGRVLN